MTKTPEELTEKWKTRSLPSGWYWITHSKRGVVPDQYMPDDNWLVSGGFNIIGVLAPVPTYDEDKAMQEQIADASKKVEGLEEEINQWQKAYQNTVTQNCSVKNECARLRALLRECKNIVAHDCWQEAQFPDGQVVERQDLLTRINAALGESEEQ